MNYINFNQTGGFPLSTNILDALQTSYNLFNQLGNLAGDFAIISGCQVNGSSVTDGTVFLNGELLPFQAGNLSDTVIITVEPVKATFQDAEQRDVIYKRQVRFGTAGPEDTYAWSRFKRIFKTTEIEAFKLSHDNSIANHSTSLSNHEARIASLEAKVAALEIKPSAIPIGMIAIWNKPSTVAIPKDWQECTDLKGRVPVGWLPNDSDFGSIDNYKVEGGERTHILSKDEMPRHSHRFLYGSYTRGTGSSNTPIAVNGTAGTSYTTEEGSGLPHNNLQPYRVVRFIEYIGPTN
ncbi:hypothetical protein ACFOWU_10015 [Epilithonimonas zeae]|uniref:Baseplate structural protein Gp10 C-terminal domain-containing protein n=1 Tax=Epilithonimonas zeae TaxID=1416779 RepID=A0A1N6GVW8_9FLAO|nr:hypothetical protein [Epilithonimonas zeae]SIO11668.1 hypothetical protein SAMN05444409_2087 [Epilithonimonas zeae]